MSYSPPSGFMSGTIQNSRLLTRLVIRESDAVAVDQLVQDVERHLDGQVLAGVLVGVEQDLGLVLVGGRRCRRS